MLPSLPLKLFRLALRPRPAADDSAGPDAALAGMTPVHTLQVSGRDEWALMGALAVCLDSENARLGQITGRRSEHASHVRCCFTGVSSGCARALALRLETFPGVQSVRLEHAFFRDGAEAAIRAHAPPLGSAPRT